MHISNGENGGVPAFERISERDSGGCAQASAFPLMVLWGVMMCPHPGEEERGEGRGEEHKAAAASLERTGPEDLRGDAAACVYVMCMQPCTCGGFRRQVSFVSKAS